MAKRMADPGPGRAGAPAPEPACEPPRTLKEAADRCRMTPTGRLDPSPHRIGGSR